LSPRPCTSFLFWFAGRSREACPAPSFARMLGLNGLALMVVGA